MRNILRNTNREYAKRDKSMNKSKRIILGAGLISIMISVCLLVTGCGKSSKDGELSGEITFCTWGSEQEIDLDQRLVDKFMELNPGTTVNLEVINADYGTTIETRFLGGEAPDVIYGHPRTFLPWAQQGMLMDLSELYEKHEEWWDEDTWNTELYKAYQVDGKYYAVPNGADVFVLYYNKTMCDKAGVDYPDESWTWDELLEWGKKLTKRKADGTPKTFGLYVDESGYYGLLSYIYANGGSVFDDIDNPQKVIFYSDETVEILENYVKKVKKDKSAPEGDDWDYVTGGFISQEVASYVSGVYDSVFLSDIEDFEWDMTLLPQKKGSKVPALYAGYAVCADTKEPELAKAFVEFCMTDDAQKILAETGLITVANRKIASSDEVINYDGAAEHNRIRVDAMDKAVNMDPPLNSWVEMINEVITPNMTKLINDDIKPDTCAKNIQKGLEKLLKEELESREKSKEK